MCLACEEMDLYFGYLEQVEAAKRAAIQAERDASSPSGQPEPGLTTGAKSRFVCDDTEGR